MAQFLSSGGPIFAWVIAIVIMLGGALAICDAVHLAISRYCADNRPHQRDI